MAFADYFTKANNGVDALPATFTSTVNPATTTATLSLATGWPVDAVDGPVHFTSFKTEVDGSMTTGSQTFWKATLTGTTLSNMARVGGSTSQVFENGDPAIVYFTPDWANDVVTGIKVQHNQDGTHKSVTTDTLTASGTVQGATIVATGDSQLRSVSLETIRSETEFDYIASGGVWSGDAYASTRNASMTALTCYINGRRGTISAVSARSFTASKDTYVDILNSSGTFSLVYTEVANNAASPALAANSIRLAIIVTGASNIANVGAVNQGQEDKVLPIASSIPYAVTDSLGNLICPRDSTRNLLGYKQIVANFATASTSYVQVTGVSSSIIVPANRKVKISVFSPKLSVSAISSPVIALYDGVVGVGSIVQTWTVDPYTATASSGAYMEVIVTPSATNKTYNLALKTSTGTATLNAASTNPSYIKVELV